MSIYLGEQTLNSLLSLCNKSSQSNESYENKIKILKNEKMLLNDANYTNNKSLSSLNKNGNYEDHDSDTDSVQPNAFFVNATDSVHDNDNDSVQDHASSDNDNASDASSDNDNSDASSDTDADATEKLNAFFVDGNYNTNIIIMPSAGALNGREYCNLITRITSMRNIGTNNLLQKNITTINNATDNDMALFMTFNINSDAVNVNRNGSALVGTHNISLDKCDITYRGFDIQYGRNVQMEFRWQKTPGGNYFVSSYVVDEVNDEEKLNLSAVYYLGF